MDWEGKWLGRKANIKQTASIHASIAITQRWLAGRASYECPIRKRERRTQHMKNPPLFVKRKEDLQKIGRSHESDQADGDNYDGRKQRKKRHLCHSHQCCLPTNHHQLLKIRMERISWGTKNACPASSHWAFISPHSIVFGYQRHIEYWKKTFSHASLSLCAIGSE